MESVTTLPGLKLWKLVSDDRNLIAYRPIFARLTGSATAAILLQQILFRWDRNGERAFYKFKDAPLNPNPKYSPGDSWCEEIAFTRTEFDTALSKIGTKIVQGTSKRMALDYKMPDRADFANDDIGYGAALDIAVQHLIVYWTDGSRLTWYQLNTDLLDQFLQVLYAAKVEILIYLDKYRNRRYLGKSKSNFTCKTESTIDNHIHTLAVASEPPVAIAPSDVNTSSPQSEALAISDPLHGKDLIPTVQDQKEPPPKVAEKGSSSNLALTYYAMCPKCQSSGPRLVIGSTWTCAVCLTKVDTASAPVVTQEKPPASPVVASEATPMPTEVKQTPSSPDLKPAPKPRQPRPRDPIFDAVAMGSFGLTNVEGGIRGRINRLIKEIKDCTPEEQRATLGGDLSAMYEWRKKVYPSLSAPTQGLTICKYLAEWRAARGLVPVAASEAQWMPGLL